MTENRGKGGFDIVSPPSISWGPCPPPPPQDFLPWSQDDRYSDYRFLFLLSIALQYNRNHCESEDANCTWKVQVGYTSEIRLSSISADEIYWGCPSCPLEVIIWKLTTRQNGRYVGTAHCCAIYMLFTLLAALNRALRAFDIYCAESIDFDVQSVTWPNIIYFYRFGIIYPLLVPNAGLVSLLEEMVRSRWGYQSFAKVDPNVCDEHVKSEFGGKGIASGQGLSGLFIRDCTAPHALIDIFPL